MSKVGRRPDGPGAYHYEFSATGVVFDCLVHFDGSGKHLRAAHIDSFAGMPFPTISPIDNMPGDFVPLTKPVAVPATWSQEPPDAPGFYEVWHVNWQHGCPENGVTPAEIWIDDRYDPPVMMFHMAGEDMYPLSEAPSGTWYKPLRLSQPPGEEVGP